MKIDYKTLAISALVGAILTFLVFAEKFMPTIYSYLSIGVTVIAGFAIFTLLAYMFIEAFKIIKDDA